MNAILNVLTQHSRLKVFEEKSHSQIDVKGWLANQGYYVDENIQQKEFSLRPANPTLLINAMTNECNRMSIAAIESIIGVYSDSGLKKSGAWGIIRCYYAAFFAAHSILRMYGYSFTQLDPQHTQKIYELAVLFEKAGDINRIEKGFYLVSTNKTFTDVKVKKLSDSHADLWSSFLKLINSLIESTHATETLSKFKLETLEILESIKTGITYSRCTEKGNWLSSIRNDVNYKHTHGAWYPHDVNVDIERRLSKISTDWEKYPLEFISPKPPSSEIEYFFNVSLSIMSLFRELLTSSAKKTKKLNDQFKNGSIRILNSYKVN